MGEKKKFKNGFGRSVSPDLADCFAEIQRGNVTIRVTDFIVKRAPSEISSADLAAIRDHLWKNQTQTHMRSYLDSIETELNRRSSTTAFRASIIVALAALTASIVQIVVAIRH